MKALSGICDSLCLWAVGTKCDVDVMLIRWRCALDMAGTNFCERDVFPVQTCVCVCYTIVRLCAYVLDAVARCVLRGTTFCERDVIWVCVLRGRLFTHSVAGTVFWSHVLRIRGRSSIW